MPHPVLQLKPLHPVLDAQLARDYDLTALWQQPDADAFLSREGGRYTGLVTSARFGARAALFDQLPSLEVVTSFGVGLEAFDLDEAKARGIAIGYTADVLNDCVADTAFGLLMDVARRFSAADRFVRRGAWPNESFPLATKVSGKRMGILGLGRIGQVIARRGSGFDMEVRYHNRRPVEGVAYGYEPSLQALAEWADFLVIAAAGGDESRGLVDATVLQALGPEGFLVNIARGSVVDEGALVEALKEGRIAGAGLDVYTHEPNVPPALFELDNVVLLPHIASNTNETRMAMVQRVLDNLVAFYAGRPMPTPVP